MKALIFALAVLIVALGVTTDAACQSRRSHVETGVLVGTAFGVESPSHSTFRAVTDIGLMWENYAADATRGWGGGATFYANLGHEDFRLGFTPRVRYRFRSDWSFDVSAGVIFLTLENEPPVSDHGFVGALHLNYGKSWTLRADVNVKRVDEWTTYQNNQPVVREGGYETAVYGGVALRSRAGWIATAVGVSAFLALVWYVVASGGVS